MIDRRNNRDKAIFRYLLANHLNQKIFNWLLKNRADEWEGFLGHETVKSMKVKDETWIKKWVIRGTQDFLDALAGRKTRQLHSEKQIRKDPYIYELLRLLKTEGSHNRPRVQLENLIDKKIAELNIPVRAED